MSRSTPAVAPSERHKLAVGAIALLLASLSVLTLATLGVASGPTAMGIGLASVLLLVLGTLSIGTSADARV